MGIINFGNKSQATPKPDASSELKAQLEALRKENEALKAKANKTKTTPLGGGLSAKVSEKGCVSVYGFGKFPVTLYATQWDELLANKDGIVHFIEANVEKLSFKK